MRNESLLVGDGFAVGKRCKVPIVRVYKHLGGIAAPSGSLGPEIASRCSQAAVALAPMRKKVIDYKGIPSHDNVVIADAYVGSVLFDNTGTWGHIAEPQNRRMHSQYLKTLRYATA